MYRNYTRDQFYFGAARSNEQDDFTGIAFVSFSLMLLSQQGQVTIMSLDATFHTEPGILYQLLTIHLIAFKKVTIKIQVQLQRLILHTSLRISHCLRINDEEDATSLHWRFAINCLRVSRPVSRRPNNYNRRNFILLACLGVVQNIWYNNLTRLS